MAERVVDVLDADAWNAIVHRRDDGARRDALELARRVDRGEPIGALAGRCFTVKAALGTGVLPATAGSLLLDDEPRSAAPIVDRLRAADAILVGVTNCAEFALAPVATNLRCGTTVNPVAPHRTPGGSSAGCAAAVAGGLVPFSIGTDYGGSVRFPAACTGIYGFRPARGTVPTSGQVPTPPPGSPRHRFSTPGVLARDLETLTAVLPIVLGEPVRERPPAMVGWVDGDGSHEVDDDTRRAVRHVAALLDAEPADIFGGNPLLGADAVFGSIRACDALEPIARLAEDRLDLVSPPIRAQLAAIVPLLDPELEAAAETLQREADEFFSRCPVLVAPVSTAIAPPADHDPSFAMLAPCRAVSLLGYAALSVPAGTTEDGTPIGVQLIGPVPELLWAAGRFRGGRTP